MQELYRSLAEKLPDPGLLFLNYGFAAESETESWVQGGDAVYRYHLGLVRHVLRDVDLCRKVVLEVGCGRGGNCYYLTRYTQAGRVIGVDCCRPNVELARQDSRLGSATFIVGDAQQLPFAGSTIDVVLNLESAHCYCDFQAFLAETTRVLSPGGTFCFADLWDLDVIPLDWQARERALANSALQVIAREDISEPVFQALSCPDNICERLRGLVHSGNRELVDRLVRGAEALRTGLALGSCSYYLWKMKKDVSS